MLLTGQSAGGSSVLFQLTLPGSYGTYRAAMPQSPGAPVNTLAAGQATATAVAARLQCPGYNLACLRAVSVQTLVDAALAVVRQGGLRGQRPSLTPSCKLRRLARATSR